MKGEAIFRRAVTGRMGEMIKAPTVHGSVVRYQNKNHAALHPYNVEPEPDERPAVRPPHEADGASNGEAVALYPNRDNLFRNYPELEPDDVQEALTFAAANLEDKAAESDAAALMDGTALRVSTTELKES